MQRLLRHRNEALMSRTVHVCLGCAAQYLPPASMTYPALGLTASPVHCGVPECRAKVSAMTGAIGVPEEVLAGWARRAAGLTGQPRRPRPSRRSRGGRGTPSPGTRSRLL
ncbi:hypothetical protein ABT354_35215 [Streptomyces sp. NPDC000594]|uniref:hypothetical protein n=1 Tax=Streptomyces sp. NPDC000594 TaxID=3154261 RepID=UPI0033346F9D